MAKKRRHKRSQAQRMLSVRVAPREGWGLALEVGDVTQSVSVPQSPNADDGVDEAMQPGPGGGYWGLMLPANCPGQALLLGLGGGTVAHLLARRCPDTRIVGVERDEAVLTLARDHFGLAEMERQGRLTIVHADAFAWVAEQATLETPIRYDLICLDLFEGGRLALGALATPFLRQIAALLAPAGTLTVNLMVTGRTPEQLHRLRRVFVVTRELKLRGNLVAHLRLPTANESLEEAPDEL